MTAINREQQFNRITILKILLILILALYIIFIPKHGYSYPVHGDEWIHLTHSQAVIESESITFTEPFEGKHTFSPTTNLEFGFHLFLACFQLVTNISWLSIFRYLPSIIFLIALLCVYLLTEKRGYGWEAVFFTCLIPTTIGILGPAFLVPVALGLVFLPLILYITFNYQRWPSYLISSICMSFLLIIHPPSAIIILLILTPSILISLKGNLRHSLGTLLAVIIPLLISLAWASSVLTQLMSTFFELRSLTTYITIPSIVYNYGYLSLALAFLGIIYLLVKGGKHGVGFVLGFTALVVMLLIYYRLNYGVPILYERGLLYLMLMLSIMAGAGLASLRYVNIPSKVTSTSKKFIKRYLAIAVYFVVVVLSLVINIPIRQQEYYYYLINDEDYRSYTWIRDNLGDQYQKAILDPWKATAFTAITQKSIYTRIHTAPSTTDNEAYDFLRDGCVDTTFLKENNIAIIYNEHECDNTDLIRIKENIYLFIE